MVRTIQAGEGQVEYTPIGHSTSLAARLQTLANPGSIAISEAMRKLVEGYFTIGLARIKGSTDRVEVYEMTGLGPLRTRLQRSAGRGLTKFVGREREMEASGMQRKKHAKGTVKLSPWWQSQDLDRDSFTNSGRHVLRAGRCWKRSRFRMARARLICR